MEINKETVRGILHGWCDVPTDAPVQITPLEHVAFKGVLIYCPGSQMPGEGNTAPVWIGGNKIAANDTDGSGGFPIMPGSTMALPVERPNEVWVISSDPGQKIAWMVI